MCLNIREKGAWVPAPNDSGSHTWVPSDTKLADRTKRLKNSEKPIKVYKILKQVGNRLLSQFTGSIWTVGKVKVSSRNKLKKPLELTQYELKEQQVFKGLHFYMNKKDAIDECSCYVQNGEYQIWEVSVDPKDVVAFGEFAAGAIFKNSLVAHKAKLVKRIK